MLGDDFRIFCGVESLSYPMLALGAAGLMSAVGNVVPEPAAALYEAVDAGAHASALAVHRQLFRLNQAIFFDTNPVALKHVLARAALTSAEVRPPLAPLDEPTRRRVDAVLDHALASAGTSTGP